jgi:hypothetical protein
MAPDHELAAAEIAVRTLGRDVPVTLSHELGTLGLVERENATVLNAALTGVYEGLAASLRAALEPAELYLARGDGTLAALRQALRLPATLLHSGRAAALRGAFRLTGLDEAIVAVPEGPRLAVGALRTGVARRAARTEWFDGVWGALPAPEIIAVTDARDLENAVRRLAGISQRVLVAVGAEHELLRDVPASVDGLLRPPDAEFARAVGVASGIVGGTAERVCLDREDTRRTALAAVRVAACEQAVQMGADPADVAVVEVELTPLASVPEPALIIRARAAGLASA